MSVLKVYHSLVLISSKSPAPRRGALLSFRVFYKAWNPIFNNQMVFRFTFSAVASDMKQESPLCSWAIVLFLLSSSQY